MAKYSYMPIDSEASTCDNEVYRGYGYFIDSDERLLRFRNQYNEKFALVSVKVMRLAIIIATIAGIIIGKVVL